ncbi:MAG: LLM class flavin-dependent oxidoreductase, partial [Gammaproteobacteria bacterium]|nr:LLM class flavin-dependent oxidoreductase [Gammaproteobacteria bacterium]
PCGTMRSLLSVTTYHDSAALALAGSLADRVTLAVGADLDRLAWGIDTVRRAAEAAGRDAASIPIGAYINVAVGTDRDRVRESIRGGVATFAHFSAGAGTDFSSQPEIMRRVTSRLQTEYDTAEHSQGDAAHAKIVDQDFIDWFAIAGTAEEVIERLTPIVKLGLSHIYFAGGRAFGTQEALAQEVMPTLRAL